MVTLPGNHGNLYVLMEVYMVKLMLDKECRSAILRGSHWTEWRQGGKWKNISTLAHRCYAKNWTTNESAPHKISTFYFVWNNTGSQYVELWWKKNPEWTNTISSVKTNANYETFVWYWVATRKHFNLTQHRWQHHWKQRWRHWSQSKVAAPLKAKVAPLE